MEKIFLAIGHRELEEYLKAQLHTEYEFTDQVVYKEGIFKSIEQNIPDIVIIRETLPGKLNIMSIVYEIRNSFEDIRIIFLAGNRKPGDELLATLVNYGIFDILYGENILAKEIIDLIKERNTYNNIKHLQPVPTLDESRNTMLFEAPKPNKEVKIIEITKEVEGVQQEEYWEESDDEDDSYSNEEDYFEEENKYDDFIPEPQISNVEENIEEKSKKKEAKPRFKFPEINLSKSFKGISNTQRQGQPLSSNKEKIVTFVGGKNGVGATSLAVNTAFLLAEENNKVIFVEFNEKYPSTSYWYETGLIDEGIDTFLTYLDEKRYKELSKAIVKSKDLKKTQSDMQKSHKKFPNNIDFLSFSKEYLANGSKDNQLKDIKEMYMYLMYQLGYDFVILDVPADILNEATRSALLFSNYVFSVITQDVSSVGYHLFNLNRLNKEGINIQSKNTYIINRYVNSNFNESQIKKWIGVDKLLTIPDYNREFVDSNLVGVPVVISKGNPELRSNINKIKNIIQ